MGRDQPSGFQKFLLRIRQELRWLTPGLGIKRWILVILVGTTLLGVGIAMWLLEIYRSSPDTWWLPITSFLYLNFLERSLRVIVFGGIGVGLVLLGIWGLNHAMLRPFMKPGRPIIEAVSAFRRRERGPRVVGIGGGNGLATLLRGLKLHTNNLTAIVTVADDGGSSGEIRRNIGILPPGDIRNCLAALSDDEALLSQIFQYRFSAGAGLNGHSLGNLFITAMTEVTGSFEEAVAESGRVLAIRGQVIPATLHDVKLAAEVKLPEKGEEIQVKGESQIPRVAGQVKRVWMEPNNPPAFPPAIQAILSADLIVVGPGSLYTSIIPNFLVPDLAAALRSARALKFYVCNVATQHGETDHYGVIDHVRALEKYVGQGVFDLVICNNRHSGRYSDRIAWVNLEEDLDQHYPVYLTGLVDEMTPWRHDSKQLGQVVMDLFYERTGPLIARPEN